MSSESKRWVVVSLLATLLLGGHATLLGQGSQGVNLWRLSQSSNAGRTKRAVSDFQAQYFEQPLDHFSNTSETFGQRYWISTRHYTPGSGGPVYVLDGGETSGEDRLSYLDTG